MKRSFPCISALALLLFATTALAGGYPWRDNAFPLDFFFGNHFDTHQQSRLEPDGELMGFLYVTPTGEEINGIPVMKHSNENTPAKDIVAGWSLKGVPGTGTFVFHDGDHPIFLVEREDIPQPGAFSHFHWLGGPDRAGDLVEGEVYDGYFLELQATELFYFDHHDDLILIQPGLDSASHVNLVGSFPE